MRQTPPSAPVGRHCVGTDEGHQVGVRTGGCRAGTWFCAQQNTEFQSCPPALTAVRAGPLPGLSEPITSHQHRHRHCHCMAMHQEGLLSCNSTGNARRSEGTVSAQQAGAGTPQQGATWDGTPAERSWVSVLSRADSKGQHAVQALPTPGLPHSLRVGIWV